MTSLVRATAIATCAAFLAAAAPTLAAADAGKQVTISGNLACAMCILKQKDVKTCTNVVVVKEKGKEVIYALTDNAVTQPLTMAACEKVLPVKVTGTVTEAGGKKTITASKVEKT
jgi:hypothetical protein